MKFGHEDNRIWHVSKDGTTAAMVLPSKKDLVSGPTVIVVVPVSDADGPPTVYAVCDVDKFGGDDYLDVLVTQVGRVWQARPGVRALKRLYYFGPTPVEAALSALAAR